MYCSCSRAVHHRLSWHTYMQPKPALTDSGLQLNAALVCHLMVSTPVIHVITWITTHLTSTRDGRLSWPSWLTRNSLHTKWSPVNHRSGIDQGKSAGQRPTTTEPHHQLALSWGRREVKWERKERKKWGGKLSVASPLYRSRLWSCLCPALLFSSYGCNQPSNANQSSD